jgi:site-specific DNA-methyltransferase (adenine-specific)
VENNADSANAPVSFTTAKALWDKDKKEFELWALSLVGAKPRVRGDRVDGILEFLERGKTKQRIIVQVRGGKNLTPGMIQDLLAALEQEGAVLGLIISLYRPILSIITDSVHAGSYESELWKRSFLKIQIRTVGELLEGKKFDIPQTCRPLKKVSKVKKQGETSRLL